MCIINRIREHKLEKKFSSFYLYELLEGMQLFTNMWYNIHENTLMTDYC